MTPGVWNCKPDHLLLLTLMKLLTMCRLLKATSCRKRIKVNARRYWMDGQRLTLRGGTQPGFCHFMGTWYLLYSPLLESLG